MSFSLFALTRLDWGFENPNKTAVLIGQLTLVVWALPYLKRNLFWISLSLSAVLMVLLGLTQSRAGLIATLVALFFLALINHQHWTKPKVLSAVLVSLIAFVFILLPIVWGRYAKVLGEGDASIGNRLRIYNAVPNMIIDAPDGWGYGNSGAAYMAWYQDVHRSETYRTLVSSHFTWLVEFGWPFRIFYVVAWFFVLVLCYPRKGSLLNPLPFALWFHFFLTASLSSVAEEIGLWLIPLLALAYLIYDRVARRVGLISTDFIFVGVGTLTIFFMMLSWAWFHPETFTISKSADLVLVGSKSPDIVLVGPEPSVVGAHFGQAVRESALPLIITPSVEDLKTTSLANKSVIITDDQKEVRQLENCSRIVFLNPKLLPPPDLENYPGKCWVYWGEFRENPNRTAWQNLATEKKTIQFIVVPGAADYLEDWLSLVKDALKDEK